MLHTLSIEKAAKFLHMSTAKLGELARSGRVKAAKPGRRWVFLKEDLVAYLDSLYSCGGDAALVDANEELSLCRYQNAEIRGGLISPRQTEREYANLLGRRTKS